MAHQNKNPQVFIDATEYIATRVSGTLRPKERMSMRHQNSNQFVSKAPLCPGCAQIMGWTRITWRFEDLPELYVFECRSCGVSHIEAAFHDFWPREQKNLAISN
jgi:hypothetical protein